ncbi:TPA: hypothetical protein JG825_003445 [Vibrio parahaemolyticus]|uniref:hypothetical protein n=1 Tax=Vibrio harveyi TaxID=669 RepID=UPI001EFDD95E|nr:MULTISPECIES: hypothetical protein [Vibrio harveyi group]MCG9589926.1 hypothetical protein [Vibrio harveyi]MCG9670329.1 hypothetical protein [Vibrio harveyi]UPR19092.1 hypothetical protein H9J99_25955 [Vibrio parahaemolyticus]WJT11093.1 hypothetical protein PH545_28540 [Vibrio harveyi]HAV1520126.1 hypothetical protein [Vibrio parahaemolyticus]
MTNKTTNYKHQKAMVRGYFLSAVKKASTEFQFSEQVNMSSAEFQQSVTACADKIVDCYLDLKNLSSEALQRLESLAECFWEILERDFSGSSKAKKPIIDVDEFELDLKRLSECITE